jgi:hypothetical protein
VVTHLVGGKTDALHREASVGDGCVCVAGASGVRVLYRYYEDGAFGIRIENLLMIREAETANRFGGVQFYGFEALTLIPIQTKLIVPELMAASDIAWLDAYHATVWERVSPRCEGAALEWLRKSTLPLAEQVAAAAA